MTCETNYNEEGINGHSDLNEVEEELEPDKLDPTEVLE